MEGGRHGGNEGGKRKKRWKEEREGEREGGIDRDRDTHSWRKREREILRDRIKIEPCNVTGE